MKGLGGLRGVCVRGVSSEGNVSKDTEAPGELEIPVYGCSHRTQLLAQELAYRKGPCPPKHAHQLAPLEPGSQNLPVANKTSGGISHLPAASLSPQLTTTALP